MPLMSPWTSPLPPDSAPEMTGGAIARLAMQGAMIRAAARCVGCGWSAAIAVPIGTGGLPCPGCGSPESVELVPAVWLRFLPQDA